MSSHHRPPTEIGTALAGSIQLPGNRQKMAVSNPTAKTTTAAGSGPASAQLGRPRSLARSHEEVEALIAQVRALDLAACETESDPELLRQAVESTRQLLDRSLELLGSIIEISDDGAQPKSGDGGDLDFFNEVDALVSSDRDTKIADLAFMARMELRDRSHRLETIDDSTPAWSTIAACSSVRRRIIKGLTALDGVICDREGIDTGVDRGFVTEVGMALDIRCAYTKFRKAVLRESTPTRDELKQRLRLCAVQFAILVGREVYQQCRIADRFEIRALQTSVLQWLRTPTPDLRAGLRIWQDLTAFAALLVQINRRAELRTHDRDMLERLAELLARPAVPWEQLRVWSRSLLGLDDELDACIENQVEDRELWTTHVQRLRDELEAEPGTPVRVRRKVTDAILVQTGAVEKDP